MKTIPKSLLIMALTLSVAFAGGDEDLMDLARKSLEYNAQASQEFSSAINQEVMARLKQEANSSNLTLGDYAVSDKALEKTLRDLKDGINRTKAKSVERYLVLARAFARYKTHISGEFPSMNYTLRIKIQKLVVDGLKNYF